MRSKENLRRWFSIFAALGLIAGLALWVLPLSGQSSAEVTLARGAGTTIIEGGTGASGGFVPVLTKIAFHVERSGQQVTGSLECLALAPEAATGAHSGEFTVNVMYVTGKIIDITVHGDTAKLLGEATVTGLGVGTKVPFTFAMRRGGPGTTSVLVVGTLPNVPFREVLLEGNFEVYPDSE